MVFGSFAIAFYLTFVVHLLVHEAGHALAAALVRFRILEIRLGGGRPIGSVWVKHCQVLVHLRLFSGWVISVPTRPGPWRLRHFIVVLGGPLASLYLVMIAWKVVNAYDHPAALGFFLASVIGLLLSVWPRSVSLFGRQIETDGLQILRIIFRKPRNTGLDLYSYGLSVAAERALKAGALRRGERFWRRALRVSGQQQSLEQIHTHGWLLAQLGRVDEARAKFQALIERTQTEPRAHAMDSLACMAIYFDRADLLDEARATIEAAIAEFPKMVTLRGTRASILYDLGERKAARAEAEQVLAATDAPTDIAICSALLARLAADDGDHEKARVFSLAIEKALPQLASDRMIHNYITRLRPTLPSGDAAESLSLAASEASTAQGAFW